MGTCWDFSTGKRSKENGMGDVMSEVNGLIQCKECPWYKSCVVPMRFTTEDLKKQLETSPLGMNAATAGDAGMQSLLASMAAAAQNSMVEACPIFIERLRASPKLAQKIKEIMQNWSKEG